MKHFSRYLYAAALLIPLFTPPSLADIVLDRLGFLAGGTSHSEAMDVSNDGEVVTGRSISSKVLFQSYFEAFRYELFGFGPPMHGLGDFDDSPYTHSWGNAISADRSVIVGTAEYWDFDQLQSHYKAFKSKRGLDAITSLFIGQDTDLEASQANDVNANGNTIVGWVTRDTIFTAPFLWSAGDITYLDGGAQYPSNVYGEAKAVDAEGRVVAGTTYSSADWIQAACWTLTGSGVTFDIVTNASGAALGISSDGKVAVGYEEKHSAKWPFYYETDVTGARVQYLDWLPGTYTANAEAIDISADKSVIVGWCASDTEGRFGQEAVMWIGTDHGSGMEYTIYSLNDFVDANSSIDRDGFVLIQANAITDDGQVIVGTGYSEQSGYEAFRLRINGPPSEFVPGWNDNPGLGPIHRYSRQWTYSPTMGCVYLGAFPWVFHPVIGYYLFYGSDIQEGVWVYVEKKKMWAWMVESNCGYLLYTDGSFDNCHQ